MTSGSVSQTLRKGCLIQLGRQGRALDGGGDSFRGAAIHMLDAVQIRAVEEAFPIVQLRHFSGK